MSNTIRATLPTQRAESVKTRADRRNERRRKLARRTFESGMVSRALDAAMSERMDAR